MCSTMPEFCLKLDSTKLNFPQSKVSNTLYVVKKDCKLGHEAWNCSSTFRK